MKCITQALCVLWEKIKTAQDHRAKEILRYYQQSQQHIS